MNTRPYATKAWQVLTHIAASTWQGKSASATDPPGEVKNILVVMITGDRGLAGAYNSNVVRFASAKVRQIDHPGELPYGRSQRPGSDAPSAAECYC